MRRILASLIFAHLLLVVPHARAVTYDLTLLPYCDTPACGHASVEAYQDFVYDTVQAMNVVWKVTGISFRPNLMPTTMSGFTAIDGCPDEPAMKALRADFQEAIHAMNPQAIVMHLWEGPAVCCSNVASPEKEAWSMRVIFCDAAAGRGSFNAGVGWAHEMGHHFCLSHTMSWQDQANTFPDPPNHDYDAGRGVFDTSPDPGPFENWVEDDPNLTKDGANENNDLPRNLHEWCVAVDAAPDVDDGSPHSNHCGGLCTEYVSGEFAASGESPPTHAVMSYWEPRCAGPYVVNGQRTEGLTPDSVDRIEWCIDEVPIRGALPDVCAGFGGDQDHDGWCDFEDNCPAIANTNQNDADDDDVGDLCDLCPNDADTDQKNTDGDDLGDACDDDDDGDFCDDDVDKNPLTANVKAGTAFNQNCGTGLHSYTAWEGGDPDGDGVRSCVDRDSDNDGICDGPEAASHPPPPADPAPDLPEKGCIAGPDDCPFVPGELTCHLQGAPVECLPTWLECLGSGCAEFALKLVELINPSPATETVFEQFTIVNTTIYANGLSGLAISEVASIVGAEQFAGGGAAAANGPTHRLEIWRRDPAERVAIVAEYSAAQVTMRGTTRATMLAITPRTNPLTGAQEILIEGTYAYGLVRGTDAPDGDRDGRPDIADNCTEVPNPEQRDANRDGFGDVCDADVDDDLVVSDDDVAAIVGCAGADPSLRVLLSEPEDAEDPDNPGTDGIAGLTREPPPADALERARACEAMDINGDARIDARDAAIARDLVGRNPGPSGLADVDLDGDSHVDIQDNCRLTPNRDQADADRNGRGDRCECGDVDDDAFVADADLASLRERFIDPRARLGDASKCNVYGTASNEDADLDGVPNDCDLVDAVVLARALKLERAQPPITATCGLPRWD